MRSRLKIAERMTVGFGLMLVVLAMLLWVMNRQTGKIDDARHELSVRIAPLSEVADSVELRVLYVALATRVWLVNPTPETLMRHGQRLAEARASMLALELLPKEPEAAEAFEKARPLLAGYLDESQHFVARVLANAEARSGEQALAVQREQALEALRTLSKVQHAKSHQSLLAIQTASEQARRVTAIAAAIALALSVVVGVLTVGSVREPAQKLVDVASRMERGDWSQALELAPAPGDRTARDELGILRDAFRVAAAALERREQRLKTDALVARAAGSSLSRGDVSQLALEAICAHLHAEIGVLYWARGDLVPLAVKGLIAAPVKPGEGIVGRAAVEKRPQLLRDSLGPEWMVQRGVQSVPAHSVLAVPIVSLGEVLAVIALGSLGELGDEAVSFLEVTATQLAIGLQNAAAHEQIKTLVRELGEKGEQIQAQNEELQVQNEELQVQGEEIRTQNEELQSQAQEIKAQNEELARATARLRGQAEVLAEEDERKTEFLGVLAHELRNPLAAISNSLFALTHSDGNVPLRERAEQVIARQTRQLSRLIEDLLDVTRINRGKIRIDREVVDLAAVLRTAVEDCKGAAERAGTRVELEVPDRPAMVEGDPVRLQQVFGNLIDNAIKFGGTKQPVMVSLSVKEDRSSEVKVRDDGEGIDAAVLARLFVPFSQADTSVQRHRSGLGLGLALVRALVELHGGSVTAFSAGLGHGAEFCVKFPTTK